MVSKTTFYNNVNAFKRICLGDLIRRAGGDPYLLVDLLNDCDCYGPKGVQLCLRQDTVDGSDSAGSPDTIWDGRLVIENNCFYWVGTDGPGLGSKEIRTRVYLYTIFLVI